MSHLGCHSLITGADGIKLPFRKASGVSVRARG